MKKDTIRSILAAAIVLVIYNLVVFAIPFIHTAAFWISYGFSFPTFALVSIAFYIAFLKRPDAKSRFYGFPLAVIGTVYGVAQLVVSLLVMALAAILPWWVPTLLYAIGFGFAALSLLGAGSMVEQVHVQDQNLKEAVSVMRNLQSKVSYLAAQSENPNIRTLAEEFRYSDPVSNAAIAAADADLAAVVDELQSAYVDGDTESVDKLCRKAGLLLAERNRLCKLNK